MALCTFADHYTMFGITPIENLFIEEFMLKAPGNFVKVYIYGLKQCYHPYQCEGDIESFSKALGMEVQEVLDAFKYWERQGILKKKEDDPLSFEFFSLKDVLYNNQLNSHTGLYQYQEFNQNLQMLFQSRLLQPQEYQKIYDWIEIMGLPQEVVLMLIQLCISKKGKNVSINYIDKVALSWAKEGITTLQAAEEYIRQREINQSGAYKVLKQLGIRRAPSIDEMNLLKKWTEVYGFSMDAILYACRETTKIQSPNMGYLDKILENYYKMNITTAREIQEYLESRDSINNLVKEVLYELGVKEQAPTPELQAMYMKWAHHWGFKHPVILLASRQAVRRGGKNFESVEHILENWMARNLKSQEDIDSYLAKRRQLNAEMKAVLDRAGDSRPVTPSDRRHFRIWTEEWGMTFELVLLAAEYSAFAENKIQFMHRILENWKKKGIRTVQEAQEEHERHRGGGTNTTGERKYLKKELDFHKFEQHEYTDEDFDALFEDIENA